jgi:hypothetical protein
MIILVNSVDVRALVEKSADNREMSLPNGAM